MEQKRNKLQAAVELGRLGGLVRSPKKAQSSKINGRKGGRPKGKKEYIRAE